MRRVLALSFVLALTPASIVGAAPFTKFKNCTELRKKFPVGVAQSPKSAGTSGAKVSKSIYSLHKGLDRDKDGIACEK